MENDIDGTLGDPHQAGNLRRLSLIGVPHLKEPAIPFSDLVHAASQGFVDHSEMRPRFFVAGCDPFDQIIIKDLLFAALFAIVGQDLISRDAQGPLRKGTLAVVFMELNYQHEGNILEDISRIVEVGDHRGHKSGNHRLSSGPKGRQSQHIFTFQLVHSRFVGGSRMRTMHTNSSIFNFPLLCDFFQRRHTD